jgi:hypothetical protein
MVPCHSTVTCATQHSSAVLNCLVHAAVHCITVRTAYTEHYNACSSSVAHLMLPPPVILLAMTTLLRRLASVLFDTEP